MNSKKIKKILKITRIIFIIFCIVSIIKTANAATFVDNGTLGVGSWSGYSAISGTTTLLYDNLGAKNRFSYGQYPYILVRDIFMSVIDGKVNDSFNYIIQLQVCQTSNDTNLVYDSGSIHNQVTNVELITSISGGTCRVNVYDASLINYYYKITGNLVSYSNPESNYGYDNQDFTLLWSSHSYNEFSIVGLNFVNYSSDLYNSLLNAKSQEEINNKMNEFIQYQYNTNTKLDQQINQNQTIINNQNETNNILNDSSIPSDSDSKINGIIQSTQSQNANISDLVNFIPNTLRVIINGFNNNCTGGYSLGSLYGTELVIPCINPVDYLGSFLWGVIDSILCLCYLIPLSKFLINKYNDLTSMKNLRWQ